MTRLGRRMVRTGAIIVRPKIRTNPQTAVTQGITFTQTAVAHINSPNPNLYRFYADWNQDGDYGDTQETITSRVLTRSGSGFSCAYGRDVPRAIGAISPGQASLELNNTDRYLSPQNANSPLYGLTGPGVPIISEVHFSGYTYKLFTGHFDDYTVNPDPKSKSVNVSCIDGLGDLVGVNISTPVYRSVRSGDVVNIILDTIGWPAGLRDIDAGASIFPFWWSENGDAFQELENVLYSEGPPATAYIGVDGSFIFRDRHHRLTRTASITSQATFNSRFTGASGWSWGGGTTAGYVIVADSDATDITTNNIGELYDAAGNLKEQTEFRVTSMVSAFGFTNINFTPDAQSIPVRGDVFRIVNVQQEPRFLLDSFSYNEGFKDIINYASYSVEERTIDNENVVWSSDSTFTVLDGEIKAFTVQASGPFIWAVVPDSTDVTMDYGTVITTISRDSGVSTTLYVQATGGPASISHIQLRAHPIVTAKTTQVQIQDSQSVTKYGQRSDPNPPVWSNIYDAQAIGEIKVSQRARPLPTVTFKVFGNDVRLLYQLTLDLSDRITVVENETAINGEFYIERIAHEVVQGGKWHFTTFSCEMVPIIPDNVFYLDVSLLDGSDVLAGISVDTPEGIFILDQSLLDVGKLAH